MSNFIQTAAGNGHTLSNYGDVDSRRLVSHERVSCQRLISFGNTPKKISVERFGPHRKQEARVEPVKFTAARGREGMNALSDWPRNRLLLALPSRNLKRLMPELEHIRCQRGQVLMDADSLLDHVFFPDSGVVSVVAVYADGSVIEMATIGREGCTGMQAFFGARTSSVRLLVQIPGSATKMSRVAFARAMESMPSFRHLMSAYIHAFLEPRHRYAR